MSQLLFDGIADADAGKQALAEIFAIVVCDFAARNSGKAEASKGKPVPAASC